MSSGSGTKRPNERNVKRLGASRPLTAFFVCVARILCCLLQLTTELLLEQLKQGLLLIGEVALLGGDNFFYALAVVGDYRSLHVVVDNARAYIRGAGDVTCVA